MPTDTLEAERLVVLLEQLEEEMGHGWQTELAKRTGVHQTTISKARNGDRQAGLRTVAKLRGALRIRPEFFSDRAAGPTPDYRDFLEGEPRVEDEDVRVALAELLAGWDVGSMGAHPNDEEVQWLRQLDFRGDREGGLNIDAWLLLGRLRDRRRQIAGKRPPPTRAAPPTTRPGRVKLKR